MLWRWVLGRAGWAATLSTLSTLSTPAPPCHPYPPPVTAAPQVRKVLGHLFRAYPCPLALASASPQQLEDLLRPLGLWRTRAAALRRFSDEYTNMQVGTGGVGGRQGATCRYRWRARGCVRLLPVKRPYACPYDSSCLPLPFCLPARAIFQWSGPMTHPACPCDSPRSCLPAPMIHPACPCDSSCLLLPLLPVERPHPAARLWKVCG